jgi:hypothetical protein
LTGPCPSRRFEQEVIRIQLGKLDATKLDGVAAADLDQGNPITLLVAADGDMLHVARAVDIGMLDDLLRQVQGAVLVQAEQRQRVVPRPDRGGERDACDLEDLQFGDIGCAGLEIGPAGRDQLGLAIPAKCIGTELLPD